MGMGGQKNQGGMNHGWCHEVRLKDSPVHLISLYDQPEIKAAYYASLKLYHQKLKCTNTWSVSMGYSSIHKSIKNKKAVQHLPNSKLKTKIISLIKFELLLASRMKELYNPKPDIIVSQKSNRKKDPLKTINTRDISGSVPKKIK